MAERRRSLEPQQQRSRDSLRRLLQAAAEVVDQRGLEAATIPRIATRAGLTPGAVYRRFPSKDALLETMILQHLEEQDRALRQSLTVETTAAIPLPIIAATLIGQMLGSYRSKAGLLRAVRQFVQSRRSTPFGKEVSRLEGRALNYLADVLACDRAEIRHADPRGAIALAVLMTVGALWELVVNSPERELWRGLIPNDDRSLQRELTRSFLSYLGVDHEGS